MVRQIEGGNKGGTDGNAGAGGFQEAIPGKNRGDIATHRGRGNLEAAGRQAAKKRRRTRTDHPGVKLKRRKLKTGYEFHFARFRDPDTGKTVDMTLESLGLTTREARREWAIRKAKTLAKRRAELATGAPLRTHTPIDTAIKDYLTACSNRLRDRTISTYKEAIARFTAWAGDSGISQTEQLTRAKLTAFREHLTAQRRQTTFPGSKQGEHRKTDRARSAYSTNKDLHSVKGMLNYWREKEILHGLDKDAISDSLKNIPATREQPAYLPPADCRRLLEKALSHDNAKFDETRKEHAGLCAIGTTPKYEPIAPFIAFLLLTGCRVGEALALRWQDVDLDALDAEGRKIGEIRLQATATKTKRWRAIGLEVCPSLRTLLAAMKLKAGKDAYVFGGKASLPRTRAEAARKRLIKTYGAPRFSWQNLRQSAGTYLTNAPGIYGAASAFMSARQLGHSVTVAEKHYLGVVRGIPREARTLEAAMQIEELTRKVSEAAGQPRAAATSRLKRRVL